MVLASVLAEPSVLAAGVGFAVVDDVPLQAAVKTSAHISEAMGARRRPGPVTVRTRI